MGAIEGERERERGSGSHGWFTDTPASSGVAGEAGEESTEITEGPDIARGAKSEGRRKNEALHAIHDRTWPLEDYTLQDKIRFRIRTLHYIYI